jgi:hypothetical protein
MIIANSSKRVSRASGFRLHNIQRILSCFNQSFKGLRMEQNGDEIVVLKHATTLFRTFR